MFFHQKTRRWCWHHTLSRSRNITLKQPSVAVKSKNMSKIKTCVVRKCLGGKRWKRWALCEMCLLRFLPSSRTAEPVCVFLPPAALHRARPRTQRQLPGPPLRGHPPAARRDGEETREGLLGWSGVGEGGGQRPERVTTPE